jgi:hypothetical protein
MALTHRILSSTAGSAPLGKFSTLLYFSTAYKNSESHRRGFPQSGRPGRIERTRELVISRTPHIVAYRIAGDIVQILRVLHGARRWPDDMSEEAR